MVNYIKSLNLRHIWILLIAGIIGFLLLPSGNEISFSGPPSSPQIVEIPKLTAGQRLLKGEKIDLNAATPQDLEVLPGIGPKLAAAIVARREKRGRYRSVDELDLIRGIGPKKLDRIRPMVVVTTEANR